MPSISQRIKLTKRRIDRAVFPDRGERILRDADLPGFGLRITKGAKTFIVEKRVKRRLWKLAIGPYGPLTAEGARERARDLIGKLVRGEDPLQERRELPFGELADLYLERYAARKKSIRNDKGVIDNHLSEWRSRRLSTITRRDIALLHARFGKDHPIGANRIVALLRTMFARARDWGVFNGDNPASRIQMFPEVTRDRFVHPDELPRLFLALKSEPNPYIQTVFVAALLTGARKTEILTMEWSHLDLKQRIWRVPHTKAGRSHVIPLPDPLVKLLRALPHIQGNPYVFPGRHGRHHLVNVFKSWTRLRKRAGLEDVRIHDLRRTLGSWLVGAGSSLPLIGKILNHSQPATTQIYARLQLDPVRQALEANAKRMLKMAGGLPTQIRRISHGEIQREKT